MDVDSVISIIDQYDSVLLKEQPDYLFWEQSPSSGVDLDTAEAFAQALLQRVAERRQVHRLRQQAEKAGRYLSYSQRRLPIAGLLKLFSK